MVPQSPVGDAVDHSVHDAVRVAHAIHEFRRHSRVKVPKVQCEVVQRPWRLRDDEGGQLRDNGAPEMVASPGGGRSLQKLRGRCRLRGFI